MTSPAALHAGPTSAQVIEDVFALHFPHAESVLDLTYGAGTFWRWPWQGRFTLHANDAYAPLPETGADVVAATRWDFTRVVEDHGCPEWQKFDVVVFDPPFTANGPQANGYRHQDRYGATRDQNGAPQNIHHVHRLLDLGTREACRLARHGVIVKTQSVIESGRYHDSETVAAIAIRESGWRVEDKVWFLAGRRPQPDAARKSRVQHFRNRPSVFFVAVPL